MSPLQGQPAVLTQPHVTTQCLQKGFRAPLPAHGGLSVSEAAPFPQRRTLLLAVELINSSLKQAMELLLKLVPNKTVQQRVDAAVGKRHADAKR